MAGLSLSAGAQPSNGPPAPQATPPEATLRLLNRDIVTLRAELVGAAPAQRVQRAHARILALDDADRDGVIRTVPFSVGEVRGIQVMAGTQLLFALTQADVDPEGGPALPELADRTVQRLEAARQAWHASRDGAALWRGIARTVAASLVALGLAMLLLRFGRKALARLQPRPGGPGASDGRAILAGLVAHGLHLLGWLGGLLLVWAWLSVVLSGFAATQPLADSLIDWSLGQLAWLASGAWHALPGVATALIVLLLTRAAANAVGAVFDAMQRGSLHTPLVHPETASATRRITSVLVWGLGVAVAYPYLPGADSDAFKGISVLVGLMVTLGSTGIVTQAMSGLVVVYSRALRQGDFVEVAGTRGVVLEVSALATKVLNLRNEEITIPNAVLVASPIHNFSKLAASHGHLLSTVVTIGYDAPWRQVHALLLQAAAGVQGIRPQPQPRVYQRALSDFYVEYELLVAIEQPLDRIPLLSALHAGIQDAFNQAGVQIMSPHFLGQPERPVVVPPAQWQAGINPLSPGPGRSGSP